MVSKCALYSRCFASSWPATPGLWCHFIHHALLESDAGVKKEDYFPRFWGLELALAVRAERYKGKSTMGQDDEQKL